MATQVSTQGSLAPEFQTFYDRVLLENLWPNFVHGKFGQKRPIPKNNGKTIQFRKFSKLAPATTPLTEGTTPAGNSLSVTAITATVSQYGDFIEISDIVDLTALDPILTETAELLGKQAAETLDAIVRDVLAQGTNVQYANGRTARNLITASDVLTVTEIRKAVRTLKAANVPALKGGDYVAIVHPYAVYDLQSDSAWQDVKKYSDPSDMYDGEIGRLYGVRFVETSNAKIFTGAGSGGINVYSTLILGADAYGVIDVAGSGAVQNIIKPFGSAGTADPLNQRSTSGWKALFTAKILDDTRMVRIEHACTNG